MPATAPAQDRSRLDQIRPISLRDRRRADLIVHRRAGRCRATQQRPALTHALSSISAVAPAGAAASIAVRHRSGSRREHADRWRAAVVARPQRAEVRLDTPASDGQLDSAVCTLPASRSPAARSIAGADRRGRWIRRCPPAESTRRTRDRSHVVSRRDCRDILRLATPTVRPTMAGSPPNCCQSKLRTAPSGPTARHAAEDRAAPSSSPTAATRGADACRRRAALVCAIVDGPDGGKPGGRDRLMSAYDASPAAAVDLP